MSRLITFLLLLPSVALADCYVRSATVNDIKSSITRVADIKRYVTPVNKDQFKCTVSFRAEINHVWHTGEAQSIGSTSDSIDQICSQALQSGRAQILQKIAGSAIKVDQEMICTDRPEPEVRTVRIGDIVQLSEVAPHPKKPDFFTYKGAQCKWFVETDVNTEARDLFQWQGIVCNVRKGEWQVIDKF
jgi:hypothetical protein